ncbi:hypothetical protein ACFVY4_27125 [Streptomyces sp. NPDC058299]|uniref:hypothetical protein n=1 Tax=Streptomyces sp. NPDC058299 TaxID=3346435 RepID=UPI0036EBD636
MNADQLTRWTIAEPLLAVLAVGLLLLVLATTAYLIARRTGGSVFAAALGAIVCTAYSGDTSWGFARDRLGMASRGERLFMFAAGEVALFVCGVMARTNKKATATEGAAGTPGVPGVLVWVIAGVQVVPAFTESGFWAGIVRAFFGPIMAALLWHLAMGLEIRVRRPGALSTGLPAQIAHELRERLLSYLGLAVRGRTAAQVTRDRATNRAVRLASRRWLGPWGRAALKAAVARAAVGTSGEQRHQLLQLLAARRSADQLRTIDVVSPWVVPTALEPHPSTPLGVVGAELRRMDPVDVIVIAHRAHPAASDAELASIVTAYGVPVTETQVGIARRAGRQVEQQPILAVAAHPARPSDAQPAEMVDALRPDARTDFDSAADDALAVAQLSTVAQPDAAAAQSPEGDAQPAALVLDLALTDAPHPEVCAPVPAAQPPAAAAARRTVAKQSTSRSVVSLSLPDERLMQQARELNIRSLREDGRKAPLRLLQRELRIGQPKAQRIQPLLPDTLDAALKEAATDVTDVKEA